MRNYKFTVVFTNHNFETVYAVCKADAIILAKAKMINRGMSHTVEFVKNENGDVV